MNRFKRNTERKVPLLNTASLPDLIFTLLFFFMIVSNFKEPKSRLELELPSASELEKLEQKKLITFIHITNENKASKGEDSFMEVQINDDLVSIEKVQQRLEEIKDKLPEEDKDNMSVVLKIDKNAKMGVVSSVKESIRGANVLTVNYAVTQIDKAKN